MEQYDGPNSQLNQKHKTERACAQLLGLMSIVIGWWYVSFEGKQLMSRFFFGGFMAIALCSVAMSGSAATPIPADLQKQLKPFSTKEISVNDGVVRVVLNKPVIRVGMIENFYLAYCIPVWDGGSKVWGGMDLKRIEVMNSINAQGVAFAGGRKECREAGKLPSDASKAYIAARTWVCVAGSPCRERRPGEMTSADD